VSKVQSPQSKVASGDAYIVQLVPDPGGEVLHLAGKGLVDYLANRGKFLVGKQGPLSRAQASQLEKRKEA
jgi:hypothetical protein